MEERECGRGKRFYLQLGDDKPLAGGTKQFACECNS